MRAAARTPRASAAAARRPRPSATRPAGSRSRAAPRRGRRSPASRRAEPGSRERAYLPRSSVEVAALGDRERVRQRVGAPGEALAHLVGRLEVVLGRVVQPVGVVDASCRSRCRPGRRARRGPRAAGSACRWSRPAAGPVCSCQPDQPLVDDLLLGNPLVLQLEVEALRPEDRDQLVQRFAGPRVVALPQVRRDLAGEAAGERDQPLAVLAQQLVVDARAVVEAFEEAQRRRAGSGCEKPWEFVGQQHQVVVRLRGPDRPARGRSGCPARRRPRSRGSA